MDPLANKKSFYQRILEELGVKPAPAPAPAPPTEMGPEYRPELMPETDIRPWDRRKIHQELLDADADDTAGYDPERRDEYGQVIPSNGNGRQYTLKGLKRLRKSDPEWPDQLRYMRQLHRSDEEE